MRAVTHEDEVYAAWLNLLGSDVRPDEPEAVTADLHTMHDASTASHERPTGGLGLTA